MLYQKYRPHQFRDFIGQEGIVTILKNQVKRKRTAHSYLFTGPSGVGKTSAARILAMGLNCENPRAGEPCLKCQICQATLHGNSWDLIELDGALFRGIEGIRDLSTWSKYAPLGNFKIYLIDECHQLTEPAWNALLRLLEEPTGRLTTILCTTELDSVPETARSRCLVFQFKSLSKTSILTKLETICQKERLRLSLESLKFISAMAGGNCRTGETFLEQVTNLDGGSPSIREIQNFIQGQIGR